MERMTLLRLLAAMLLLALPLEAQQQHQKQASHPTQTQSYRDELGFTCAQILALPSAEYIAKVVAIDDSTVDGRLRGVRNFGHCYDERTARLATSLTRRSIGPKKAALANLADLEQKLDAFKSTALADVAADAPSEPVKKAYAELYAKQFRYEFYESYEPKPTNAKTPGKPAPVHSASAPASNAGTSESAPAKKSAAAPAMPSTAAPPDAGAKPKPTTPSNENLPAAPVKAVDLGATAPTKPAASAPSSAAPPPPAPPGSAPPPSSAPPAGAKDQSAASDAAAQPSAPAAPPAELDPFTKAKNHFGELLGLLPPEKIHEVHSAFGKLFDGNPVSEDLKVDLYKYAIFLLEGSKDQPFAPPPF
jgi:hypothetical protein